MNLIRALSALKIDDGNVVFFSLSLHVLDKILCHLMQEGW